ncbi:predicted protein, partial [Nematostella vectensis]
NKVVRVIPQDEAEIHVINELRNHKDIKVDFWAPPSRPRHPVDLHVTAHAYKRLARHLSANRIPFTLQIPDVQRLVDQQKMATAGRASASWYSTYHTLDQIYAELKNLYNTYYRNGNVRVFTVGKSYNGKDQKAIEIKGKRARNKPVFFMNCGIHAREWVSPATCMYIAKQLLSRYGKDANVTSVLDKMDFVIMPVLNPDGYVFTWERQRFWRKTLKPNSGTFCVGTDPNRNWDYKWGAEGASTDPCADDYRGPHAFSEIEIVNVAKYLKKLGDRIKGYMDIHAYSQFWMIPWGHTQTPSKDYQELMRVSKAGAEAIRSSGDNTVYKVGPSSTVIYVNSGGSKDYTYGALGIKYSFALELRDTGKEGFLLPPEQIIPTALETFNGVIAAAKEMEV